MAVWPLPAMIAEWREILTRVLDRRSRKYFFSRSFWECCWDVAAERCPAGSTLPVFRVRNRCHPSPLAIVAPSGTTTDIRLAEGMSRQPHVNHNHTSTCAGHHRWLAPPDSATVRSYLVHLNSETKCSAAFTQA